MVLPWLAAGWMAGIAAAPLLPLPTWQWLVLALVAVATAAATRADRRFPILFSTAALCFLGAARASLAVRQTAGSMPVSLRTGDLVELRGVVVGLPQPRTDGLGFDLEASWIASDEGSLHGAEGRVRVVADPGFAVRRGDTLALRARWRMSSGIDRMRYAGEARAESVLRLASGWWRSPIVLLDAGREFLVDRLHRVFPAAEASLISGVLLGADERMPLETTRAFRVTGTAHILAVSGFNVTLVAAAALALFRPTLGARRGTAAAAAAILAYTLLAGADPPVVRAAVMAGISLLAVRLGRQAHGLTSLAAAATVMTAVDPAIIGDMGFQLSFLATLYLVIFAAPLQRRFTPWLQGAVREPGAQAVVSLVGESALVTLVAQAATLPLSAFAFHTLPLTALPANLLILPAQPALMATGAMAAAASAIDLGLGRLIAWLALPFATYTLHVAEWFATLPGASLELPPFAWPILALGYLPALAVGVLPGLTSVSIPTAVRRVAAPAGLLLLTGLSTFEWRAALDRPDGRLHLVAIPGGDVLIATPSGRFVALLASVSSAGSAATLERYLPATHRVLDWIVVPGPGWGPESDVAEWTRFQPRGLLIRGAADSAGPPELEPGVEIVRLDAGTGLHLGGDSRLEVVEAGPEGSVVAVTYGRAEMRMVFIEGGRGGPAAAGEGALATAVILVGDGRSLARLLDRPEVGAGARVVVTSPLAGEATRYDLSAPEGALLLTTPEYGWIRLSTDGRSFSVSTERQP